MTESPRIIELQQKFEDNPRRFFASLANEYRKAGDFSRAISICRIYLEKQPTHMAGHVVLGQALHASGKIEEAEEVFNTVLELDPENLVALKCLGDIAQRNGDLQHAHENFRRVLTADPRDHDTNNRLKAVEQELKLAASKPTEDWIPPRTSDEFLIPPGSPSGSPPPQIVDEKPVAEPVVTEPVVAEAVVAEPVVAEPDELPAASLEESVVEEDFVDTLLPDTETTPTTHYPTIAEPVALESAEDTLVVPDLLQEAGEPAGSFTDDQFQYRTAEFSLPANVAAEPETTEASDEMEVEAEALMEDAEIPPPEPVSMEDRFANPMRTGEYSLSQDTGEWNRESVESLAPAEESDSEEIVSVVEPAGPFITETIAELYVQQGFTGEALLVYRQLARSKPNDQRIADRIAVLENKLTDEHSARQAALDTVEPAYSPPPSPVFEKDRSREIEEFDRAWSPPAAPEPAPAFNEDDWFSVPDISPVRSRQSVQEFFAVLGRAKPEIRVKPTRARVSADEIRAAADITAGFGAFGVEPQESAPKPIPHPSSGHADPQDDVRRFRSWLDGLSDS